MSLRRALTGWWSTIATGGALRHGALVGLFSVLYLHGTLRVAYYRQLWNDEFFTLYLARLGGTAELWRALETGADQHPVFFYWLTGLFLDLPLSTELALRMPSVIAGWVLGVTTYLLVTRRTSALYGAVGMFLLMTTAAVIYTYEARGYAIAVASLAVALLCWESADRSEFWALGLFVALAVATASHYFAVLGVVPLVLGELVRVRYGRSHRRTWLAFGGTVAPILTTLGLLHEARTYAKTFWSKASWQAVPEYYGYLLGSSALVVAVLLVLLTLWRLASRQAPDSADQRTLPEDLVALTGFVLLPVFGVLLAKFMGGAFAPRYVLPGVIGLGLLVSLGLHRLAQGSARVGLLAVAILAGWMRYELLKTEWYEYGSSLRRADVAHWLAGSARPDLPIVAWHGQSFLQIRHYAPDSLSARMVYLADPGVALLRLGHNTSDRGALALREWFPSGIESYRTYTGLHCRFLVYGAIGDQGDFNWLLSQLLHDGWKLSLMGRDRAELLFLARARRPECGQMSELPRVGAGTAAPGE